MLFCRASCASAAAAPGCWTATANLPTSGCCSCSVAVGYAETAPDRAGFKSILIALAGQAAEIELLGIAVPTGCEHDNARADALLDEMAIFPDLAAARRYMLMEARGLARKHRRKIRKVARALRRKGALTGDEIDRLLEGADRPC
jgi:hypothetical protein